MSLLSTSKIRLKTKNLHKFYLSIIFQLEQKNNAFFSDNRRMFFIANSRDLEITKVCLNHIEVSWMLLKRRLLDIFKQITHSNPRTFTPINDLLLKLVNKLVNYL